MKHITKITMFAFVLVPGIAYPLYAGVFFLSDSLLGDRIILRQLHETRRLLWNTFWADYAHALPVFYGGGVLIFVLPMLITRRYGIQLSWLPALLGFLVGGGVGVYLSSMMLGWLAILHAIVGALLGALFSGIAHRQRGI
jgi:hypothetical protein